MAAGNDGGSSGRYCAWQWPAVAGGPALPWRGGQRRGGGGGIEIGGGEIEVAVAAGRGVAWPMTA